MALEGSYTPSAAGSGSPGGSQTVKSTDQPAAYWELSKLRRCYTDYLFSKRQELDEQIDARRYYHGSQWTREQISVMQKRKQPVMTFNRIGRKIDGVVGLLEKLRQDPKAYPRTPQQQEGSDLATAALRYVLDEQAWKDKSPICASDAAVDGIGGVELELIQGDQNDKEVGFQTVDTASFFYDPRSFRDDFSDARYMGVGKWIDQDVAKAMFPGQDFAYSGGSTDLQSNSDRDLRWFSSEGVQKKVRIVDIWYKHQGGWCWAIFTGAAVLQEGKSYFQDEKGKDISKYVMFSGNVDQDGDRYGFIRNMKSAQDGINARQSKMQHILASRRLIISQGAVDDIEKVRTEWARPDGVVTTNRKVNEGVKADDQSFDFAGWTKMLELNYQEIENFGPNPALIGQGLENQSGRAIALLQQAGMAELGPYFLAYRGWKVRVYRAIWNAIQRHWQGERWVRVTDDQDLAQFIQVNGIGIDPQTGQPTIINAVGSLDVDIILDEGPDTVNGMADVYETLSNVLPSIAPVLTPQKASAVVDILIESSPMPNDIKKKFRDVSQAEQQAQAQGPPPDPKVMAAQAQAQIEQQGQVAAQQLNQQKLSDQNAAKQQSLQMDLEHQARSSEQDFVNKHRQNQMDMATMADRHAMECEMMKQKNAMTMDHEDAKASKTDLGQIKSIADTFAQSLQQIAQTVEQAVEKATEEKPEPPKRITVQRDKTGRISGAEVVEA